MEGNRKKLIQLRTKLKAYKNLDAEVTKVMNAETELEDLSEEIYLYINGLELELSDLKMEMNLSDEEWNEDEE